MRTTEAAVLLSMVLFLALLPCSSIYSGPFEPRLAGLTYAGIIKWSHGNLGVPTEKARSSELKACHE
jgi:hypothetical protein